MHPNLTPRSVAQPWIRCWLVGRSHHCMMFPGLLLGAPPIGLQRLGQIAVEVHRAGVEGLLPLSGYVGLRGNNELAVGSWGRFRGMF